MEIKRNYQIEMEREIARFQARGERPLLALHSCCAPCSSAVLERLNRDFQIVVFYYNPNISPPAEFELRAAEQLRLAGQMPLEDVRVEIGPYDPENFYAAVRGHEGDPEGGERCGICFEMRLRKTAEFAKRIGADYFATTLTISPLKNAQRLNALGAQIAADYGVDYFGRTAEEIAAEDGLKVAFGMVMWGFGSTNEDFTVLTTSNGALARSPRNMACTGRTSAAVSIPEWRARLLKRRRRKNDLTSIPPHVMLFCGGMLFVERKIQGRYRRKIRRRGHTCAVAAG